MTIKYMHTMNGQPAFYADSEQICFASHGKRGAVTLCDSLDQIKRERKASEAWRKSKGFHAARWTMGWNYVRIN